jgi:hypothetical protein
MNLQPQRLNFRSDLRTEQEVIPNRLSVQRFSPLLDCIAFQLPEQDREREIRAAFGCGHPSACCVLEGLMSC